MSGRIRLWFQKHTVAGRMPLLDEAYERHIAAVVSPGTEVHIETLPATTYESSLPEGFVRYGAAEVFFAWHFTAQALVAEEAGYDAYLIGTSQDPGLLEARTVATIPVLGYGETAFFTCASMGLRFGVVGFIPELAEPIAENVERYGLGKWLAGFEHLEAGADMVRDALSGRPERFLDAYEKACERMVRRGAQIIVPGEGLPNEILVAAGIRHVAAVPFLDADGLLLKAAEQAVTLRRLGVVPAPDHGYRNRPLPPAERSRLFSLFAPASVDRTDR